jgi:zinc protease
MMNQKCGLLVTVLLLITATAISQARLVEKVTKKGNEIVIPYEKYVLPNGLTVIVHEDHSDPVVHVDVTYHVGSAREQIGKSGFAHFFEHMMFQGSDHVGDEQHFKIISEAGGTLNGSTNRDRTNYYQTLPVNQLEKALWLEADRMGFLLDAVTQQKFEIQRSTVKNERGQNYDNRPYGLMREVYARNLYPYGHPYSWLTIGYLEDLNRSDVNDLKNFFLRWYGPNNAVVTVGGDVKTGEVVKLVEKYFGSIPAGPKVTPVTVPPIQLAANRYVSYTDNYARLPQLAIVYPTVPDYHKDMAALLCLSQVLGQGKNAILYQTMVKKQLALNAVAISYLTELAGEFIFQITPMPGKTLRDMESLFRAALDSFEKRGVTEDDILKFKGSMEAQLINGLQSVQGKVSQLAAFQTFTGNPNKMPEMLRMIASLKKEDVLNVYQKYIKGKGAVILSVTTRGQETNVAAPDNYNIDTTNYKSPDYGYEGLKYAKAKDNFDRAIQPGNGPGLLLKTPTFWRKDLPAGFKVIGTENNEIPLVTMSISIPGGHLVSAGDLSKAGLARLFSKMMMEDTKNRTAEQMAVELQKLGSIIEVTSSRDAVVLQVQSLKKNIDKTLVLLQERLFLPDFKAEVFDRLKKQTLESFKQLKAQPAAVADVVFAKLNFGPNNILGLPEEGTEATVQNITLEDIKNYYNNYMTSRETKVVIVGDIKEAQILPKLAFLNKLADKRIIHLEISPAPAINKTIVYLVDVPNAAQTEFRIGNITGLKYDATGDFYRALLLNYPLGAQFNSRLNLNLREDKGWTYGARSIFTGDKYSGEFVFSSGIRANATDSALSEVMRELKAYLDGPTDAEVSFLKSAIKQSDARQYETGFQKAAFLARILEYNLPANYVELQNKILQNITREQLKETAARYLHPEKLNILIVGDKARIIEGVKKSGYEVVELDTDGNRIEG